MIHEFSARQSDAGSTLVDFVAHRLKISRSKAKAVLDERAVTINARRIWMARHKLKAGDKVLVTTQDTASAGKKLRILHRGAHFIVINKPALLLTQGNSSAEAQLREQLNSPKLQAAHRLDRETSGCLLFARNDEAEFAMRGVFQRRGVQKIYDAIVLGYMPIMRTTIRTQIDGKEAVTHYRVLKSQPDAAHLRLRIETGRTHQIRKHLAELQHPVVGDKKYLLRKLNDPRLLAVSRQMLHATKIAFTDPLENREVSVSAPLPKDFKDCLKSFGLD